MSEKKTIAVVGASHRPEKWSYKAVLAYRDAGWTVYPVNRTGLEVAGLKTYLNVCDIPEASLDRVTLYLPPRFGMATLADIATKRVGEFYVNPGAESDELVARARELGLEPILACSILAVR